MSNNGDNIDDVFSFYQPDLVVLNDSALAEIIGVGWESCFSGSILQSNWVRGEKEENR